MAIKDIFKKGKKEKAPKKEVSSKTEKKEKETAQKQELKESGEKRESKTFFVKRPWISEKATILQEKGAYVFLVHPKANKSTIKEEVQDRYGVRVEKVRTTKHQGKRKRHGGIMGRRAGFKKAIVTVKEGDSIEIT